MKNSSIVTILVICIAVFAGITTAMDISGVNVVPAVFIIPAIALVSLICCWLLIKNLKQNAISR